MAIRVAAWNVEGRLGPVAKRGRGTPEVIIDHLLAFDADVVFLPESYAMRTKPGVNKRLRQAGYVWYDVAYDDIAVASEPRFYNPHSRILSRLPVVAHEAVRYGDVRTLPVLTVMDPTTSEEVCIRGIHLDDRSETLRLMQVDDLLDRMVNNHRPTILLGDFNAMHTSLRARLLTSFAMKMVIASTPVVSLRSILMRLSGMAAGTTMEKLCISGRLTEADLKHRATATPKMHGMTWLPSLRIVQLDHILLSSQLASRDFRVLPDGGSDHRAITACIEVKTGTRLQK